MPTLFVGGHQRAAAEFGGHAADFYMRTQLILATLLLLVGFGASASGQECFEYGPTVSLKGTLRSQVFPGPPNYESIKRGDRKEVTIILSLGKSVCTTGNDPQGIDVPEAGIRDVQLVVVKDAHWTTVRRLIGKRAIVTGTLFHAHTGHHRTKVLLTVANLSQPKGRRLSSLSDESPRRRVIWKW